MKQYSVSIKVSSFKPTEKKSTISELRLVSQIVLNKYESQVYSISQSFPIKNISSKPIVFKLVADFKSNIELEIKCFDDFNRLYQIRRLQIANKQQQKIKQEGFSCVITVIQQDVQSNFDHFQFRVHLPIFDVQLEQVIFSVQRTDGEHRFICTINQKTYYGSRLFEAFCENELIDVQNCVDFQILLQFKGFPHQDFVLPKSLVHKLVNQNIVQKSFVTKFFNFANVDVHGYLNSHSLIFEGKMTVNKQAFTEKIIFFEIIINKQPFITWQTLEPEKFNFDSSIVNIGIFSTTFENFMQSFSRLETRSDQCYVITKPGKLFTLQFGLDCFMSYFYSNCNMCLFQFQDFDLIVQQETFKTNKKFVTYNKINQNVEAITICTKFNKSLYISPYSLEIQQQLIDTLYSLFPFVRKSQSISKISCQLQIFENEFDSILNNECQWNFQCIKNEPIQFDTITLYKDQLLSQYSAISQFVEVLGKLIMQFSYFIPYQSLSFQQIQYICSYANAKNICEVVVTNEYSLFKQQLISQTEKILQYLKNNIYQFKILNDQKESMIGYSFSFIETFASSSINTLYYTNEVIVDSFISLLLQIAAYNSIKITENSYIQLKTNNLIGTLIIIKNNEIVYCHESESGAYCFPLSQESGDRKIQSLNELSLFNESKIIIETSSIQCVLLNNVFSINDSQISIGDNKYQIHWEVIHTNLQFIQQLIKQQPLYIKQDYVKLCENDYQQIYCNISNQLCDIQPYILKYYETMIQFKPNDKHDILKYLLSIHIRKLVRRLQNQEQFEQFSQLSYSVVKDYLSITNYQLDFLLKEEQLQQLVINVFIVLQNICLLKHKFHTQIKISIDDKMFQYICDIFFNFHLIQKKTMISFSQIESEMESEHVSHEFVQQCYYSLLQQHHLYFDQLLCQPETIVSDYIQLNLSKVEQDKFGGLTMQQNHSLNSTLSFLSLALIAWQEQQLFLQNRTYIQFQESEWYFISKFLQERYALPKNSQNNKVLEFHILSQQNIILEMDKVRFDKQGMLKQFQILCLNFQQSFDQYCQNHVQVTAIRQLQQQQDQHSQIQIFYVKLATISQLVNLDPDKLYINYEQGELDFAIQIISKIKINNVLSISRNRSYDNSIEYEYELSNICSNSDIEELINFTYQLTQFKPSYSFSNIQFFNIQNEFNTFLESKVSSQVIRSKMFDYLYDQRQIKHYNKNLAIQSCLVVLSFYQNIIQQYEFLQLEFTDNEFTDVLSTLMTLKLPRFSNENPSQTEVFNFLAVHTSKQDLNNAVQIFLTNIKSKWLNERYTFNLKPLNTIQSMAQSLPKNAQQLIALMIENPNQNIRYLITFIFVAIHALNLYKQQCNKKVIIDLKPKQINCVLNMLETHNIIIDSVVDALELDDMLEQQFSEEQLLSVYNDMIRNQGDSLDLQYYLQKLSPISTQQFLENAFRQLKIQDIQKLTKNQIVQAMVYYTVLNQQLSTIQHTYNEWQFSCLNYILKVIDSSAQEILNDEQVMQYFLNRPIEQVLLLVKQILNSSKVLELMKAYYSNNHYQYRLVQKYEQNQQLTKVQYIEILLMACSIVISNLEQEDINEYQIDYVMINKCVTILTNNCGLTFRKQQYDNFHQLILAWMTSDSDQIMVDVIFKTIKQLLMEPQYLYSCFGLKVNQCNMSKYNYQNVSELKSYSYLVEYLFHIILDFNEIALEIKLCNYLVLKPVELIILIKYLKNNEYISPDCDPLAIDNCEQIEQLTNQNNRLETFISNNIEQLKQYPYENDYKQTTLQYNFFQRTIQRLKNGEKVYKNWLNQLCFLYFFCIEKRRMFDIEEHPEYFIDLSQEQIQTIIQFMIFNKFVGYVNVEPLIYLSLIQQLREQMTYSESMRITNSFFNVPSFVMSLFVLRPNNIAEFIQYRIQNTSNTPGCKNFLLSIFHRYKSNKTLTHFELLTLLVFVIDELINNQKNVALQSNQCIFNGNKRAVHYINTQLSQKSNSIPFKQLSQKSKRILNPSELIEKYNYQSDFADFAREEMKYWK